MQRALKGRVRDAIHSSRWLFLLIPLVIAIVAVVIHLGYRFGDHARVRRHMEPDELTADLTTAALGLLGLMLAFTFGWAATRFDGRREARMHESQAIASLYHLTDVLPPGDQVRARQLLTGYLGASIRPLEEAGMQDTRTRRELWAIAVRFAQANPSSEIADVYLTATAAVLDAHHRRAILAAASWIPFGISAGLIGVMFCTMALVGYRYGLRGLRPSPALVFVVIALSIVIYQIADLNRAIGGTIRLSTEAMRQTQRELRAWDESQ